MERPPMRHLAKPRLGRLRVKKAASLRAKALRWLAGFLLLMFLFTILSRAADELTIPRVTLETASQRSIDRTITAYGKAGELSARAVTTCPGIRVAGVAVKTGGKVEKNAPLFTLEQADLEEKLAAAKQELEKMDMDLRDRAGREELDSQARATALIRAQQDYAAAEQSANKEVERAIQALERAKAALETYVPPVLIDLTPLEATLKAEQEALKTLEGQEQALQQELEQAVAQARQEATESGGDADAAEQAVRAGYQPMLAEVAAKAEAARQAEQAAARALEEAKAQNEQADNTSLLQQGVETAQQDYDRAVENRETALRLARRTVEDAQRPDAPDSTGDKERLAREIQAEQVQQLAELLESGGVIRAPESGTVTALLVEPGQPVPEGTAVLLADSSGGAVFTAQVPAEQEKYLSSGDAVTLKQGDGREPITGLTVDGVGKNAADPTLLDVTVRLPAGTLEIGQTAEMVCVRKSRQYPTCVPLSVLHEENGRYYLLVPQTVQTVLGQETTAARLDVTVQEKNESYAALTDNALAYGQKYLAFSSKPVKAGDRIRQEVG
ncbi:HlyD family efflux transporter periplasmic adaptor subunit [Acutalibacter caecimuris]|uniref:HlyD family efflux transporter periplasmic adaptor subunit n=1 Tax=Acutalibacter caecimuris TaxID=3093657 RepID=UPI002AC8D8E6|nr:HlyD family efflux transporter periplasmic adaptor subunit [Acutalibacter sp. M00118]